MKHTPLVILFALSLLLLIGCAGSGGQTRRAPSPPPDNAVPTDVLPFVGFMEDADGNGYRDTIVVTIHLFARNYADASIYAQGSFDFKLVAKSGKTLREWSLPPDVVAGLAKRMPAGPAYFVRLSLLDNAGSDRVDESTADLSITFTSPNGQTARATAAGIAIGKVSRL